MTEDCFTTEPHTLLFREVQDLNTVVRDLAARVESLEADAIEQARSQEFCLDFIVQRLEKLEAASAPINQGVGNAQ